MLTTRCVVVQTIVEYEVVVLVMVSVRLAVLGTLVSTIRTCIIEIFRTF